MSMAPKNYKGKAVIRRPYYGYECVWFQHENTLPKHVPEACNPNNGEILRIETFRLDGFSDDFMTIYSHDINNPDKLIKRTYYYYEKYDAYYHVHSNEHVYFIRSCN
jgi:hypothetical protein